MSFNEEEKVIYIKKVLFLRDNCIQIGFYLIGLSLFSCRKHVSIVYQKMALTGGQKCVSNISLFLFFFNLVYIQQVLLCCLVICILKEKL
jgi:hypothetical protein